MHFISKDLTTVEGPAIIAHGVNTQNAMGSGVARALYMKWPTIKAHYHKYAKQVLGEAQFVDVGDGLIVANCFTQTRYGRDGDKYASVEALVASMEKVIEFALQKGLRELYIPRIGCGLGGLDWHSEVCPALEKLERAYSITFVLCSLD